MQKKNTAARKVTAKNGAKTIRERAQAIIADERYDIDTRQAIKHALDESHADLAVCVRRAERGEIILDLTAEQARANAEREGVGRPHTLAELAALIEAVLNHPLTPPSVRDDLWNAVNDLATPESFYNSASYIEGRLSGVAELPQEGGVH